MPVRGHGAPVNGDLLPLRGDSAAPTAKHLAVLRKAGITKVGRGRLQQIAKPFLADPASGLVDLGYLQLHLGITEA